MNRRGSSNSDIGVTSYVLRLVAQPDPKRAQHVYLPGNKESLSEATENGQQLWASLMPLQHAIKTVVPQMERNRSVVVLGKLELVLFHRLRGYQGLKGILQQHFSQPLGLVT
jgi:hypothetical protein